MPGLWLCIILAEGVVVSRWGAGAGVAQGGLSPNLTGLAPPALVEFAPNLKPGCGATLLVVKEKELAPKLKCGPAVALQVATAEGLDPNLNSGVASTAAFLVKV